MPIRIEKETDTHREAFQYYQALGSKRTLGAVAEKFKVTVTSVQRWALSFNWRKRAHEHDARAARRAMDRAEAETEDAELDATARARNLRLVQMGLMKLAQALASGDVKFALSDLDRLLKLERLVVEEISHESSDRPKVDADLDGKSADELWPLAAAEIAGLNRLVELDEEVGRLMALGQLEPLPTLTPRATVCPGCGRFYDQGPVDGSAA